MQFKSKLISVFALISLIPIISLVLVSQFIIAQSIDRWERVSGELRELRVLPMVENAMQIASDPDFIQAMEEGADLSEVGFGLSEDYIIAIYDSNGDQVFSTTDQRTLNEKLKQTIVMITHDSEAASTASRVIEMKDGQIHTPTSKFEYESELRTSISIHD